jgi:glutathione S-transferase
MTGPAIAGPVAHPGVERRMTDTIAFYHNPQSRGRIVHWMLEEANAPYEIKVLDFEKKEHKSPEYLAINPMGKIPAIVHRGTVITECAGICAYLADAFPAAGLAPKLDDPQRGTYLRWLFFGAGCWNRRSSTICSRVRRPAGRPPWDTAITPIR